MDGIQPTLPIGESGFGGGASGIWLFAILALLWGGNGFGKNGSNVATQDDLNFSRLENQVRANAQLTETKTDAINNGICKLGYEMAEKFGQTNALVIAESQKTRDMLTENKIETLQNRINQLELSQALNGVIRYPTQTNFSVPSPVFNGNCNY